MQLLGESEACNFAYVPATAHTSHMLPELNLEHKLKPLACSSVAIN
jgi:hypothetical protein